MCSKESDLWYDIMKEEINSLKSNGDLIDLPNAVKVIECKWVYKIKKNLSGNIEKYKVRFVTKGFTQKEEINYTETFSPVSKKILLVLFCH